MRIHFTKTFVTNWIATPTTLFRMDWKARKSSSKQTIYLCLMLTLSTFFFLNRISRLLFCWATENSTSLLSTINTPSSLLSILTRGVITLRRLKRHNSWMNIISEVQRRARCCWNRRDWKNSLMAMVGTRRLIRWISVVYRCLVSFKLCIVLVRTFVEVLFRILLCSLSALRS